MRQSNFHFQDLLVAQAHRLLIITHNLGSGVERHVPDLQALFSTAAGMFSRATGISDDGRTIVGFGVSSDGHTEGWVLKLPN